MLRKETIIIIGGGLSGIISAIFAKQKNKNREVIILEKNDKIGKKILVSGNGRCNLLNKNFNVDRYYSENKDILKNIFSKFDSRYILKYFENLGIVFKEEKDGKIFPITDSANSILDVLLCELNNLDIKIFLNTNVVSIKNENNIFKIKTNKKEFISDKLIISTGSCAYPQIGTTGDGYNFAKDFNHKMNNLFPSIVPLILDCKYLKKISGIRFDGIVKIKYKDKILKENRGDILFTDYGISGLSIISISRYATEYLYSKDKNNISLLLDFVPNFNLKELENHILNIKKNNKEKNIESLLSGLINPKLINYIFENKINLDKKLKELNTSDIKNIIDILKNKEYKIIGDKGFKFAQVTAGGISLKDINEKLESKKIKNLFFTGEILDVDGDCGGFNLMWAFFSGKIAGENI